MRISALLWLLALVYSGNAAVVTIASRDAQATRTRHVRNELAIVPTTTGQIGVNPVESELGNPDTYVGEIYGTDTLYITQTDTTTAVRHKHL